MNWLEISEIVRNYGLLIGGAFGLYLASRRTSASTRQADASLQQAEVARRDHVAELFNGPPANLLTTSWKFGSARFTHCVKSRKTFLIFPSLLLSC
jgi:hypothetical protein